MMSRLAVRIVLIASFALAPAAARGASGATTSGATTSRATTSGATTSGATTSAATKRASKAGKTAKRPPKNAPVVLYHVNRKETMALRLRDNQGRPVKGLQRRFDRFLRCHHTNTQHPMNMRLARLIYQTGKHWPGHRIDVVSGYRNPSVAKNPHSPHMKGLACDFHVEGVQNTELRDYLRRTFTKVGVGYYPNSSFVHLDVRKDRSAFWIDYSGPGDRAVYSENPNEDLRSGRADAYHPTKIDESWVDEEAKTDAKPAPNAEAPAASAEPAPKAELAKAPTAKAAESPTP
jgi:uncharacterized protein YcbK (DUF882 family)